MTTIRSMIGNTVAVATAVVLVSQTSVLAKGQGHGGGGSGGGSNSSISRSTSAPRIMSNQVKSFNLQSSNKPNLSTTTTFRSSQAMGSIQNKPYLPSTGNLKTTTSRFATSNVTSSALQNAGAVSNPKSKSKSSDSKNSSPNEKDCKHPCKHPCKHYCGFPFPYPFPFGNYGGCGLGGGVFVSHGPTVVAPVETFVPGSANVDLVVEDIRLIKPATSIAGPAYRVVFRNQGLRSAGQFRVGIFAMLDGKMSEQARAIVDVPSMVAGQAREVTLRLPALAMQLTSATTSEPTAFTHLVVAVDPDGTIQESDKTNNVVVVERTALQK